MSRIDELVARYAPNGVERISLGDVALIANERIDVTTIDETTYVGVDNLLPNFGGRRDSGYSANSGGAIRFRQGDVLIGNIRPYLKKVWFADRDGGASPDVLTITLSERGRDGLAPKFLYYVLASDQFIAYSMQHAKGGKMPRGDKKATLAFRIPIPPLKVQLEIVKVLDAFTELEAELGAELEYRRRQYAYYRDELLSFSGSEGVTWMPMSELGTFIRGRRFTKNDLVDDGIPSIHYGEIYTHYGARANEAVSHVRRDIRASLRFAQPRDVIIAGVGETVEDVAKAVAWLGETEVAIHDDSFAFRSDADPRYVSYVMQASSFQDQKRKHVARGKVKRIGGAGLGKIVVPVPTVEEQRRIADFLDKFDALLNDPSSGLPAEITARRRQYEYYRDRLLSFEEAPA